MPEIVAHSFWSEWLQGGLFGAFGAVVFVLAAGVYGVVTYAAAQRVREIGVRVAFGARPGDVYRLVLGHGAALAGVGLALGLLLALLLALDAARALASLLYGVAASDPATYAAAAAGLGAVALAASWVPARRAARVDPVVAFRAE